MNRTKEVLTEAAKIAQGDPNDREHYPGIPGVAHTITTAGNSFVAGVNGSNFGSMFITLDPFDQRRSPELYDAKIMERLKQAWSKQIKGAQIVAYRGAAGPRPERRRRIQARPGGSQRPGFANPGKADQHPRRTS